MKLLNCPVPCQLPALSPDQALGALCAVSCCSLPLEPSCTKILVTLSITVSSGTVSTAGSSNSLCKRRSFLTLYRLTTNRRSQTDPPHRNTKASSGGPALYRQRVNTFEHKAPRSRPAGAAAVLLHVKHVSCTVRGACQKQLVHTSKRLTRPPPSALDGVPENTVNNGPEWSPEMICPRWHTRGRHQCWTRLSSAAIISLASRASSARSC